MAADRIYAANYNLTYCSSRGIVTSFIRKGRPCKDEEQAKQMRQLLNRERSTRLEGSLGIEKQYCGLDGIKARTKQTETVRIFFGIHTANAAGMIAKAEKGIREQAA